MLVDALQVGLGHLLADFDVVTGHCFEHIAEVCTRALARLDHFRKDVLVRHNRLVQLIQWVFFEHRFVRDHENDQLEQIAEVRASVGTSHLHTRLPWLVVRAVFLQDEVAQVADHVVDEEELDSCLAFLASRIMGLLVLIYICCTIDHESVEYFQERFKLAPILGSSLNQEASHEIDKANADGFG